MAIYPVILAGGSGTRLWPLSSPDNPKQFSFLFGEQSLYQQTIQRISNMDELSDPIVTCNATHVDHVLNQTSQINQNLSYLIIEPVGRNTAPAITLAALALRQSSQISNCDPIMLVMPSDDMIRNTNMRGNPTVYITGVGLNSDRGELVAVAKLSTPIKKNFSSEATIKVKLTY